MGGPAGCSGADGRRGSDCLQLGRKRVLSIFPWIDRDAFLHAETDDLLALEPHLLGQFLGRQVVRHL